MEILRRLSDGGNTVVVIEHNLDVIKTADYIIDMGPEGGDGGGTVIAQGTPEEICEVKQSYTGRFLKPYLEKTRINFKILLNMTFLKKFEKWDLLYIIRECMCKFKDMAGKGY